MKLNDYLVLKSLRPAEYGPRIRVTRQAVDRYLDGRIPEAPVMKRIIRESKGLVTPNDFYTLPESVQT